MLLAIPFLIVVVLALPALAWVGVRQSRNQSTDESTAPAEDDPLTAVVIQIALIQTIVAALAALAVFSTGIEISWGVEISPFIFGVSWLTLGAVVLVAFLEARRPIPPDETLRQRMRSISAGNPAWIGITVYAGVVEEFAYRGVLTLLLATYIGYWPGAFASAILFGLAHLSSGRRAVFFGIPFALAMQGLVYLADGLLIAILVHAAYDLIAAWLGKRIAVRESTDQPE